jgi:acyl carrier protein
MPELTSQQILEGLAKLVAEETGLAESEVLPEKSFTEDLDIDSLSMMTIVVNAQDEFDVEIPDDAVAELKTVADAINYIQKSQSGATVGQS